MVWSRDGKSLLTASRDQTACLWSSTGALLRTFRGHLGDVEAAAFSPDGQKVVTASDDQTVILWNVDGGQPCDMLTDTPVDGWVSGLAFTPDSSQVIGSGSCDGAGDSYEAFLTDWNLLDGNRPLPLQTSSRSGVALALSPDGRQMVVGESSPPQSTVKSRVRIWSLDPPRVLATVPKLVGSVYSVAYSNDGRSLAIGTGDVDARVPGTALIVEPATGALRQKLPDLPGKVEAVFTADSRYLITVNGSKKRPAEIRFWNPQTAQLVAQINNPELAGLTTIALSPDGRYLVTGHGDPVNPAAADKAKIKIWDLATQKLLGQFPAAHPAAITRLTSPAAVCSWPPATWRATSAFGTSPRTSSCPHRSSRKAGRSRSSPLTRWASGSPSRPTRRLYASGTSTAAGNWRTWNWPSACPTSSATRRTARRWPPPPAPAVCSFGTPTPTSRGPFSAAKAIRPASKGMAASSPASPR